MHTDPPSRKADRVGACFAARMISPVLRNNKNASAVPMVAEGVEAGPAVALRCTGRGPLSGTSSREDRRNREEWRTGCDVGGGKLRAGVLSGNVALLTL